MSIAARHDIPGNGDERGTVLALLAHNDDEFFIAPLLRQLAAHERILVAYLTYGSVYGVDAQLRIDESRKVLRQIGVHSTDVLLIGSELSVFDGTLARHAERVLKHLDTLLRDTSIGLLLVPAWEGGHPDHDACNLIAQALVHRRRIGDVLYEFPAYNGCGLFWHFAHVMEFTRRDPDVTVSRIRLRDGLWALRCALGYHSQRLTFVGLLPGAFRKFVLMRRQLVRRVPADRDYSRPPHPGKLLYERRSSLTFARFSEWVETFRLRHLPARDTLSARPGQPSGSSPVQAVKQVNPGTL